MAKGFIVVNGIEVEIRPIQRGPVPDVEPGLFPDINPSDDEEDDNGQTVIGKIHVPCVMCVDKCRTVIFVPCGHIVLCSSCNRLYQNPGCPICRQPIGSRHRVRL